MRNSTEVLVRAIAHPNCNISQGYRLYYHLCTYCEGSGRNTGPQSECFTCSTFDLVWTITPPELLQTTSACRYVTTGVWCRAQHMYLPTPLRRFGCMTWTRPHGLWRARPNSSERTEERR